MVTVAHPDCGEPVQIDGDVVTDPGGARHLCRDYLAWHGPVDRRDAAVLDVPGGWRPRRPARIVVEQAA